MERRFAVHAGALALVAALVGTATAAPKKKSAKLQFQKGVAAYQKGDYDGATAAFARSFKLEVDSETLFAWAQAERKLDRCDLATDLYQKLLAMKLPAENRSVVKTQIAECKDILDAQAKPVSEPAPAPPTVPLVEPTPTPTPAPPPEPVAAPAPLPQVHDDSPLAQPEPEHEGRAWYRSSVGDSFAVAGVVGLGAGTALLISAHSAETRENHAMSYPDAKSLDDMAHSRGELGVIASAAGVALVAAAVVWYVER